MTSYLQKHRPLQVSTPIGEETLLVTGFRGTEELSRLFSFELDLIAENSAAIDFSRLVGNDVTLRIATPAKGDAIEWRYISGICARFSQGNRNEEFTAYYAEVVPKVWLLTHRAQSRIFQQKSVPDILKEVLQGFACDFQLRGQYDPREYCVQYRETDFDFASRLMESTKLTMNSLTAGSTPNSALSLSKAGKKRLWNRVKPRRRPSINSSLYGMSTCRCETGSRSRVCRSASFLSRRHLS